MNNNSFQFSVTPEVINLGVTGAYVRIINLTNKERDDEFTLLWEEVLGACGKEYSEPFIAEDPILAGFRDLHTAIGRSNRKFVASPENLIRLLIDRGRISSVNLLVDICNLVSLESRLALGAHDVNRIEGNVVLRLTNGTERFVPLGGTEAKPVSAGEYSYVDDANEVICRLEYRQVEKTKVTLDTTDCFYIIQGNPNTKPKYIRSAMERLLSLTKRFCGGQETVLWLSE